MSCLFCNEICINTVAVASHLHATDALLHGFIIKGTKEPELPPTRLEEPVAVVGVLSSSLFPYRGFFISGEVDETREDVGEKVSALLLVCFMSSP